MASLSRRLGVVGLLVLAAHVFAGCVGQVDERQVAYGMNGTFERNATAEDQRAFFDKVDEHGGRGAIFTSLPAGFNVGGFDEEGCQQMRAYLLEAAYVARVSQCYEHEPRPDDWG